MPTIKDLKNHLERYPDDWPLAWNLWQSEDVASLARRKKIDITPEQTNQVLEEINSIVGINWDAIEVIIEEVVGDDYEPYEEF